MAPTISTALMMAVLFTAFILFSKTTLENNIEISQAMTEAAELAGERSRTNIRMTNVNVSDFCDIQATVINEGSSDISDFKNMSLIVDFPDEVVINNESVSLNYTSSVVPNPGEWTYSINPKTYPHQKTTLNPGESMTISAKGTLSSGISKSSAWGLNLSTANGVTTSKTGVKHSGTGDKTRTYDPRGFLLFGQPYSYADHVIYNDTGWSATKEPLDKWQWTFYAGQFPYAGGVVGDSYLEMELPKTGTYLINIKSFGGPGTTKGEYHVMLNQQGDTVPTTVSGDPANIGVDIEANAQYISIGEKRHGNINTVTDEDYWRFSGSKGEKIELRIFKFNAAAFDPLNIKYFLYDYDPSGEIAC